MDGESVYMKNMRVLSRNADVTHSYAALCHGVTERLQLLNYKSSRSPRIMRSRLHPVLIKQIGNMPRVFCVLPSLLHASSFLLCPLNCHNKLTRHDVSAVASVHRECLRNCGKCDIYNNTSHAPLRCIATQVASYNV